MNTDLVFAFGGISFVGILIVTFIIEISSKLKSKSSKYNGDAEGFLNLLNNNKGLMCFGLILSIVGILGFTISILIK